MSLSHSNIKPQSNDKNENVQANPLEKAGLVVNDFLKWREGITWHEDTKWREEMSRFNQDGNTILHLLLSNPDTIKYDDISNYDIKSTIKWFIKNGYEVKNTNKKGETALDCLLSQPDHGLQLQNDLPEIIDLFIKAEIKPDVPVEKSTYFYLLWIQKVLMHSVQLHEQVLNHFLRYVVRCEDVILDEEEHIDLTDIKLTIIDSLLTKGAKINHIHKDKTVLDYAIRKKAQIREEISEKATFLIKKIIKHLKSKNSKTFEQLINEATQLSKIAFKHLRPKNYKTFEQPTAEEKSQNSLVQTTEKEDTSTISPEPNSSLEEAKSDNTASSNETTQAVSIKTSVPTAFSKVTDFIKQNWETIKSFEFFKSKSLDEVLRKYNSCDKIRELAAILISYYESYCEVSDLLFGDTPNADLVLRSLKHVKKLAKNLDHPYLQPLRSYANTLEKSGGDKAKKKAVALHKLLDECLNLSADRNLSLDEEIYNKLQELSPADSNLFNTPRNKFSFWQTTTAGLIVTAKNQLIEKIAAQKNRPWTLRLDHVDLCPLRNHANILKESIFDEKARMKGAALHTLLDSCIDLSAQEICTKLQSLSSINKKLFETSRNPLLDYFCRKTQTTTTGLIETAIKQLKEKFEYNETSTRKSLNSK